MIKNNLLQEALEMSNDSLTVVNWGNIKDKYTPQINSNQNILLINFPEKWDGKFLLTLLEKVHRSDHEIYLFIEEKEDKREFVKKKIQICNLENITKSLLLIGLFIPAAREKVSMLDFQELVAHLRSSEGCPWDRKQTHQSLRPNLLEESYEVLNAIDNQDSQGMCEEFGDLLLQIVLHAQIASESRTFNLEDIITGIQKKLIYRHPHIFGDITVSGADEVIKNWEVLKAQERKENHKEQRILRSVPTSMPALSLAQAYQKRAARVGFDWETIDPVKQKIYEELNEVDSASNEQARAREFGDVLFAVVNLIRWYGFDAESLLREASARFAQRFEYIEECVEKQGKTFAEFSLAELDVFWDEAKKRSS